MDSRGFRRLPKRMDLLDAGPEHVEGIERLLVASELPVPDPEDPPVTFLVLVEEGEVIACAGYERHGTAALVRSVAVAGDRWDSGLGTRLVRALISELYGRRVEELWLVTMNAAPFFSRFGFAAEDREAVPKAIREDSPEYEMHACLGGVWMRRRL